MHGFRRFCSCSSSNMGRKVVDFEGSFLGRYFVTFFGAGLLAYAGKVPIFGSKIWTRFGRQKTKL